MGDADDFKHIVSFNRRQLQHGGQTETLTQFFQRGENPWLPLCCFAAAAAADAAAADHGIGKDNGKRGQIVAQTCLELFFLAHPALRVRGRGGVQSSGGRIGRIGRSGCGGGGGPFVLQRRYGGLKIHSFRNRSACHGRDHVVRGVVTRGGTAPVVEAAAVALASIFPDRPPLPLRRVALVPENQ